MPAESVSRSATDNCRIDRFQRHQSGESQTEEPMLMADGPIELLSKARAGETEALGELCALYRNYLRMVVRTGLGPRLRERVELSDVVQEALVEVVRQFPQFTGQNEAALVGWLRRLVGQKLADLGRYHSRAKRAGAGSTLPLDAPCDAAGGPGRSSEGGGPAARHAGPEPDQPQRGRQPPRADRPAGRRPGRPARDRGRYPLALSRREPLVRGDRRARGPEPEVGPGHLGSRAEASETVAGRAARGLIEV